MVTQNDIDKRRRLLEGDVPEEDKRRRLLEGDKRKALLGQDVQTLDELRQQAFQREG